MFRNFLIAVLVSICMFAVGVSAQGFLDIEGHWGQEYIEELEEQGVVDGKAGGLFDPDSPITRAELTKLAYAAFESTEVPTTIFETVTLKTNMGDIKFYLFSELAPRTTENFQLLAQGNFYDNNIFHRVINDFMIQGGDFENSDGTGGYSSLGPDTTIEDEFHENLEHLRGAVSMANAGPNTGASQFFIVQAADGTPWLDNRHSVFGQVYEGMDIVDAIAGVDVTNTDKPVEDVVIKDVILGSANELLEKPFEDVEIGTWYAKYLYIAKSNGIINGFADGTFQPNNPVNRAEALKIIIEASGEKLTNINPKSFSDTGTTDWYANYLSYAWNEGLISGYEGDLFRPANEITRAEVSKIVYLLQQSTMRPEFYDESGGVLELTDLNKDFSTDGENVYFFSELGFAGIIHQLDFPIIEIPAITRIYFETIPNITYSADNYPVIFVDHVSDPDNSYLLISSDLFDGKGNLWREAINMIEADLDFERLADELTILIVPNDQKDEVEFVGKHHFKIGNKAYYLNNEIEGVDAESFSVYASGDDVNFESYTERDSMSWMQIFSHDNNNVYARGELIEGADWETFDSFPETSWYYWDKYWIYNGRGERLENSDSETFRLIDGNFYAKDKNNVYLKGEVVPGADPETYVYDGN